MAVVQSILMLPGRTLSRAGSLLQGVVVRARKRVGAGLPAMAVGQSTWCWMCWPHRWRASSHSFGGVLKKPCWAQSPVGVSLLAMAVIRAILMLPGWTYREQAHSYRGWWFGHEKMWELACQRWRWGSRYRCCMCWSHRRVACAKLKQHKRK